MFSAALSSGVAGRAELVNVADLFVAALAHDPDHALGDVGRVQDLRDLRRQVHRVVGVTQVVRLAVDGPDPAPDDDDLALIDLQPPGDVGAGLDHLNRDGLIRLASLLLARR